MICKHRFRRSFRGVYSLTRWFIFIFRSTNQQCFFKSLCKRLNPATINEFTEAQKLISSSKGFSSRLEENFPALILLFPRSKIWEITQNTGKVSFKFKCLSAQWQRRTLTAKCFSSLWWYLTLMIVTALIFGRNRKCSSEIAAKSGRLKSTLSTTTEHPREQWKCCLRKIHELRKTNYMHINE